ncbi:hypothetical protein KUTeg_009417, partial [Tegillarca granosa]
MLKIDPRCKGCIIDDKFGYNSYQGDCTRFVQCYPNGTNIAAKDKKCGLGQFWSQEVLTCVESLYVDCPDVTFRLVLIYFKSMLSNFPDPCKTLSVGAKYDLSENCNAYWTCFSGRSLLVCCPPNERFNATENRCIPDATCTDKCPEVPNNSIIACSFEVDQSDDRYYFVNITGWSYRPRQSCACGTRFNPATCACDLPGVCNLNQVDGLNSKHNNELYNVRVKISNFIIIASIVVCEPIVYMDNNGTMKNKQGQDLVVGVVDTTTGSGSPASLQFSGSSALNIWRLAMYDFKQALAIRFSLKVDTTSGSAEQVLLNCLHASGQQISPSIDIKYDPTLNTLIHTLITADGKQILSTNMQ